MAKRRRSRAGLNWKTDIGGMPVWAIVAVSTVIVAIFGVVAVAPVIRGDANAQPYVRPSDAFDYSTPAPEAVDVVFLGDSYTAGYLLPDPSQGFAYLAADDLGWSATIDGQPSTGYVATGAEGSGNASYVTRAARIPADADAVVVSGGLNDEAAYRADPAAFSAAVTDTLTTIKSTAPDARVIVVGPFWPYESAESITAMNGIVSAAAVAAGAEFIDTLAEGWMFGVPLMDDGLHPTAEGHRALADRLAATLG